MGNLNFQERPEVAQSLSENEKLQMLERIAVLRMRLPKKYSEWLNSAEEHVRDGQANPELLSLLSLSVPTFAMNEKNGRSKALKRFFDLFFLAFISPVFVPIGIVAAFFVCFTSKGPVFYKQLRLGKDGVPFWVFKFRTMYVGAEQKKPEGVPLSKFESDPRVTPVGRILRKHKLDEIPQFINVIKGNMSLIGPRPLSLSDSLYIDARFFPRFAVNPGLTGLWQVERPDTNSPNLKLKLDSLYAKKTSFWLDFYLLFATIPVLIRGEKLGKAPYKKAHAKLRQVK